MSIVLFGKLKQAYSELRLLETGVGFRLGKMAIAKYFTHLQFIGSWKNACWKRTLWYWSHRGQKLLGLIFKGDTEGEVWCHYSGKDHFHDAADEADSINPLRH